MYHPFHFISKYFLKIKTTRDKKTSLTLEYLELKFFSPEFFIAVLFKILKYVLWFFFSEHLKPLFYFSAPLLIQISIYFGSRRSLWELKSQLWLVKHIVWLPQFVVCLRISFNHLYCAWLCIYIQHMETVMLLI